MTEEQALALLRERDPAGLDWFIRRYGAYVSAVVWNIIGRCMTAQDAEEVASDVFLALWQNGDRPRPGKVKGYLGSVARNRAINRLRDRGVELGTEEDILSLPADGPERAVQRRELARLVKEAVESLPPPDREIFIRYYYYCQSAADIAGALDLSAAAVRKRLERGRDRLRRYLEERGHFHDLSDVL